MSNGASAQFTPPSLLLTTIGLSLATFMQVLDTTIANVALPTISGNLGVSYEQGTWVITSFAVSNAIALPLTGWLSRRFGEVKLFIWATLLFVLASFLCGIAQSMPELVGFRVLQGVVAGPLYPMTQTLLIAVYPPAKRGMALALLAMVTVVAPIAGPILGGWITDSYSWPWIFFINVPIGLFAAAVVRQQMRTRPVTTSRQPMDYIGLLTLIVGVGALQVVLDKGNDLDWFESSFIVVGSLISAVFLAIFVIWELTDRHPVVNLRLFVHRNFRIGTLVLVGGYAGFFGINLILPQWLQTQMGYTATWAGLAVAPIGLLPVIMSPFVGKYAHRFDLRLLAGIAFLAIGASCYMRAGFTSEVDFLHIALVQLFMGIGVALFFMPTLTILLSDLPPHQIADGSGLATFLRTLGGSFAASLTTWIWIRRADQHHAYLSEHISQYDPATRHTLEQLGGASPQSYAQLEQILNSQAYMMSTVDYFTLLTWVFGALILLVWLARPPFTAKAGPASAGH
ncbi:MULTISPECIES: DHA2 family efflux MFS transporter permease subunit [Pseudomonas]|uniref:DHA2 family efflux MFS transporter permease subunit n=1 Tax=Pseudomonas TaxID=286 RepID=UPI0006D47C51|nr:MULTISPECIES: DHA2 family efflux MFS transporter permease subunit [Pseudomonas]QXI45321.1 DHA2 family efflux MFS transporter permease subunit [Pseudomonas wayambapalatensis]ANC03746.1 multidrug resistance protein B [Pseudomonas putida]MBC3421435.1 DHA2 family efflux MFS transporter permease subunit [Pseudomonas sp. RW3S2]MBC3464066.1 DHA2 family efflux MFS transporter permease subunit [Pseudomonas sp. RW10S2]HEK0906997.1 DHA2 family efflux MFS transporter permease subunit [Pseudomonas putid